MRRHLEKIVSLTALAASVQGGCVKRATPAGYTAMGCYDWTNPALSSAYSLADQPDVTYDKCSAKCDASGATYFGIAEGYTCYCGSSLLGSPKAASANDCWYRCSGDATQWCGGPGKIDLFSKGGPDAVPAPTSSAVTVPNPPPIPTTADPQPQPTSQNPPVDTDPYTTFTSTRSSRRTSTRSSPAATRTSNNPPPATSTRDPYPTQTSTRDYPTQTSTRDYPQPTTTTQNPYPRTTQQTPTYDGSGQICLTIGRDYTCFSVPTGATVVSGPGLTFDPGTRAAAQTTGISWNK